MSDGEETPLNPASKTGIPLRIGAGLLAITPLTLLTVAFLLKPSAEGLGTHQQLGLPPCSMRMMMGIRCPGCGMTTSWSHFTKGQFIESFQVNAGGFLLAAFSIVFAGFAAFTAFTGKPPTMGTQKSLVVVILAIVSVTIVDWIYRLST